MSGNSPRRKQQIGDIQMAILCVVGTPLAMFAAVLPLSSLTSDAIALSTIPLLVSSLAVAAVFVALHQDVSWTGLGLGRPTLSELLSGVALGAMAVSVLAVGTVWLEWAAWVPANPSEIRFDWREARLAGLSLLAVGAVAEELAIRGILLQFLARAVGPAAAIALTSSIFALLHWRNPEVTELAPLNTALFGAVFGIAVLRHRSLWLAFGLHFGWNAAQVGLGANTSGLTIRLTELNLELGGAEWLTGGEYGLEGGALATGMAVVLGAGLGLLPRRRDASRLFWQTARVAHPESSFLGVVPPGDVGDSGRGEDREADDGAAR